MIKNLQRVFGSVLLIIICVVATTSCQTLIINGKKENFKKIVLLSFEVNRTSTFTGDQVMYPNIHFIGQPLYDSFLQALTNRAVGLAVKTLSQDVVEKALPKPYMQVNDSKQHIVFPWNLKEEYFTDDEMRLLLNETQATAYMVVRLTTSVWAQNVRGFIEIKSPTGNLLWKQSISIQSTYIISDAASPYLTSYDNQLIINNSTSVTHKEEIIKIYQELGTAVGMAILKHMNKRIFKIKT